MVNDVFKIYDILFYLCISDVFIIMFFNNLCFHALFALYFFVMGSQSMFFYIHSFYLKLTLQGRMAMFQNKIILNFGT
jgi:hypothetical protein